MAVKQSVIVANTKPGAKELVARGARGPDAFEPPPRAGFRHRRSSVDAVDKARDPNAWGFAGRGAAP